MILSQWSGRISTQELEVGALRNDWMIETDWGGHRTASPRMDSMKGAAKI